MMVLLAIPMLTSAWMTSTAGEILNTFDVRFLETSIEEYFPPDQPVDQPIIKEVSVRNQGTISLDPNNWLRPVEDFTDVDTHDAFVRVRITVTPDIWTPGVINQRGAITIDINTTYWTLGPSGFFYYNRVLESGQATQPIFTRVNLHEHREDFDIMIYQEAVMSFRPQDPQYVSNGIYSIDLIQQRFASVSL